MAKKIKSYSEAQLIDIFGLKKTKFDALLLVEWLDTDTVLLPHEQITFDQIIHEAKMYIEAWNEEDLKMNFIAFIISLSNLKSNERFRTYFEKTVEAQVEGHYLKVKTDFMVAKGILDLVKKPYFHFQEYKKEKDPYGDPIAQLLEAFLVAQEHNQNQKPLYGCYVVGRLWYFVVMENKHYCVSSAFDSTQADDLLKIIAVLRKFKDILETRLLD